VSGHRDSAADVIEPAVASAQEPSHIGARLRQRREQAGLSLRDLAGRIGVSASLISQIERDKVNPSVSTLWALVRELGFTMGELFAVDADDASGVTWERLTAESDPAVEFLRVVYDVGSESCPEDSLVHHGGKEYGYVISGRLGVRIGFDEYDLGPGHSISFDASSPHRLWAIGSRPAEVIWAVVGRQGDSRSGSLF
jgi:transcriptional regulator with XRE-family HTH domain